MTTIDDKPLTEPARPALADYGKAAGKAAGTGALAAFFRLGRGLRAAPGDLAAWLQATEYDEAIGIAKEAKDAAKTIIAKDRQDAAVKARRTVLVWALLIIMALACGGWMWASAIFGLITFAVVLTKGPASCTAPGAAFVISLIIEMVRLVKDWPLWPWPVGVLVVFLLLVTWAAGDGSVTDNLPTPDMAPAEPEADDTPPVIKAVLATRKLPADATPMLVQPGVIPAPNGSSWSVTVDTGGPSATVLLETKARAELASQLGLSSRRLIATVDEDLGRRLHLTGITGEPWADDIPHPLLKAASFDTWSPVPFGTDHLREVTYRIPGVNALFGGESGAGKSVAVFDVVAAFALSPKSKIYAIDGGEVDTEILRRTGLAEAWTTELGEGTKVLAHVLAEVNRRQSLLAAGSDDDDVKADRAFMDQHGIGHDLVLIDELATFSQGTGKAGEDFTTLLRQIAQRCRKTGVHLLLSTQSPSKDAIDPDARDVIPVRWCGRARTAELAAKVLGSGTIGRGVDPRTLRKDVDGLGWLSDLTGDSQVRPYNLSRPERAAICRRGVELRKGARSDATDDGSKGTLAAVAALIRAEGATVNGVRVMRTSTIAERLGMDQMTLASTLRDHGIRSQKIRRTDSPEDENRMHYVLQDFPVGRAG